MTGATRAFVSLGSNVGDAAGNVRRAIDELKAVGRVAAVSSFYRTRPWGPVRDQPDFVNAVVAIDTPLQPRDFLERLQELELRLGRAPGRRYGPRVIDLDIALYGDLAIDEPGLVIPHRHLQRRAFVLVPLAEIDARYEAWRDRLPPAERESVALMSGVHAGALSLTDRLRLLAGWVNGTDVLRIRIEREGEEIELGRRLTAQQLLVSTQAAEAGAELPRKDLDLVKADLVGIFHFVRPVPFEGELLEGDRELAYIEALGIRNPVRSRGTGRIAAIKRNEGDAVEYGAVLFEIDRG
jgi:2-amino-4-hydroxy-6-hydroxymethyldihydropteridine diphosphokinase